MNRKAFSLIELIAALAIIATLTTLGAWATKRARQRAHLVQCSHNLKQIYQALMEYLEDHHDQLPVILGVGESLSGPLPSGITQVDQLYLKNILAPYLDGPVDQIFSCPARPDFADDPQKALAVQRQGSYDSRGNAASSAGLSLSSQRFSAINNKARRVIAGDWQPGWHDHGDNEDSRMINVLFADGHVQLISEKQWQEDLSNAL